MPPYHMTDPLVLAAEATADLALQTALTSIKAQQELLADKYIRLQGTLTIALKNKTDNSDLVTKLTTAKTDIAATKALPNYTSKYDPVTRGLIDVSETSINAALLLLAIEQGVLDSLHASISINVDTALTDKDANQKLIDSLTAALKAVKNAEKAS